MTCRWTFTDYLDDVSGLYPDNGVLIFIQIQVVFIRPVKSVGTLIGMMDFGMLTSGLSTFLRMQEKGRMTMAGVG